jgi:hypothetical protein
MLQDNMNMEAMEETKVFVESEVSHTHWGKNSLIVLCMSKSFLSRHLLNKDELVEGNKDSNGHLQPSLAQ